MSDAGRQTIMALDGIRTLFKEIHALMAEVARLLDRRGWANASPSRKASHLTNAWNRPQDWLPKYLYRWYSDPLHPGTLLVLVVHLEIVNEMPPQPWVVLGAYIDTGLDLNSTSAEIYAAGLHIEGEEETASGTLIRADQSRGHRLSLAVPLLEMDGPESLQARLITPLLAGL